MLHSSSGFTFAGLTDTGLQRSSNQDSYYASPAGDLFIVADGMGGHAGGQEASRLAVTTITEHIAAYADSDVASPVLLERSVLLANDAILSEQQAYLERADMGTTVVVLLRRNGQFWCAHVGDSRLYLLRESGFFQITQDHTWVAQSVKTGLLKPEQQQQHPWRHVLSQCVGREDLAAVETQQIKIEPADRLLLCSDGLTEDLSDDAMITCLQSADTCKGAASMLIEAAKAQGGRDNITVVALFL